MAQARTGAAPAGRASMVRARGGGATTQSWNMVSNQLSINRQSIVNQSSIK
jgi:hypothetical protein